VPPSNLELRRTLDEFIGAGFHSVGFSPMLAAPNGTGEMQADDLETMLGEMIDCGQAYELHVLAGRRYPFANMMNAMRELQRGTHRPYPCGAGRQLSRRIRRRRPGRVPSFVGDEGADGLSAPASTVNARRIGWPRATHRQSPAVRAGHIPLRGGCHHEVIRRGRSACDTSESWLHYCLGAYLRLSAAPGVARRRFR
jgi:uncharacterized protein